MAKTRSMRTRDAAPWSLLDHDVLLVIMMQLIPLDFLAFSGVCKSWRSVALSNRSRFMSSSPPMNMSFPDQAFKKMGYLQYGKEGEFKTILPHSAGRTCVGVTCGYVILFGEKTRDFWLVNLITRRKLHFPNVSFCVDTDRVRAILVDSPSLSARVFVISNVSDREIWFSIAGKGAWNRVSSGNCFLDLHAFKGKIYTLNTGYHICELTLDPEPKLTMVGTKSFSIPGLKCEFVSSGENLYLVHMISELEYHILELDIGEMKWVSCEKTISEYAFFLSHFKSGAAVKPLSWHDRWSRSFGKCPQSGHVWINMAKIWYFSHDSLNVNCLEV